jgi:hypothetical protein
VLKKLKPSDVDLNVLLTFNKLKKFHSTILESEPDFDIQKFLLEEFSNSETIKCRKKKTEEKEIFLIRRLNSTFTFQRDEKSLIFKNLPSHWLGETNEITIDNIRNGVLDFIQLFGLNYELGSIRLRKGKAEMDEKMVWTRESYVEFSSVEEMKEFQRKFNENPQKNENNENIEIEEKYFIFFAHFKAQFPHQTQG